jgi:hypothetical protein
MRRAVLVGAAGIMVLSGATACGVLPGLTTPPVTTRDDGKILRLPEETVGEIGTRVDPSAGITPGEAARGPLASLPPLPSDEATDPTPNVLPTECMGRYQQGVRNGLTVTPSATSAVVTWWNLGDPALVEYQLTAVSQALNAGPQPKWTWQKVAKAVGCTRVSATVSGLAVGAPYVFVLHAVLRRYESLPPTIPEIGRSAAVRTVA